MSSAARLLRRLARRAIGTLPGGARVPILTGAARGMWWRIGAHTHGCWLGTYERDTQARLTGLVRPGDVVYDVGANAGFYTLLSAALTGPGGRVVAFEPLPENAADLESHVRWNRLDARVEIVRAAVADTRGVARFAARGSATGGLDGTGALEVRTVTVDEMVRSGGAPPPQVLKIDVEGAEYRVLTGALGTLRDAKPKVLLELHTPEMDRLCSALLRELGYAIEPFDLWPDGVTPRGGLVARADA